MHSGNVALLRVFEVAITIKDEGGNDEKEIFSGTSTTVYSSIYGGATEYSVKEYFGYNYASLATVMGLATDSTYKFVPTLPRLTARSSTETEQRFSTRASLTAKDIPPSRL